MTTIYDKSTISTSASMSPSMVWQTYHCCMFVVIYVKVIVVSTSDTVQHRYNIFCMKCPNIRKGFFKTGSLDYWTLLTSWNVFRNLLNSAVGERFSEKPSETSYFISYSSQAYDGCTMSRRMYKGNWIIGTFTPFSKMEVCNTGKSKFWNTNPHRVISHFQGLQKDT